MLKTIALVILAAVIALLLFAVTRPDSFGMQRSTTIAAPPDKVFGLINDLKGFNSWNPWALKDPTSKLSYEGSNTVGVGAAYNWKGESTGEGRMEIIESVPAEKVAAKLEFKQPMATTNRVEFTLVPQSGGTAVTWTMTGPMPFMSRLMSAFITIDKMVGPDFEAGLANLKTLAEKP